MAKIVRNPRYFDTQIINFEPVVVRSPVDGFLGHREAARFPLSCYPDCSVGYQLNGAEPRARGAAHLAAHWGHIS